MRILATIEKTALCNSLGVEDLPAAKTFKRRDRSGTTEIIVSLGKVQVDGDDAWAMLRDEGYGSYDDDDAIEPPDGIMLQEWIAALIAGDLSLAAVLAARVFSDDASREICERALRAPMRRAA